MATKRKRRSADFKAKVAIEAVKGLRPVHELAKEFSIHPTQISQWKQHLLEGARDLFSASNGKELAKAQAIQGDLYQEIGRLKMDLGWLKKKSHMLS